MWKLIWTTMKVIHGVPIANDTQKSTQKIRLGYCLYKQVRLSVHGEMNFGAPPKLEQ
jgi:hypothetical protein